MADTLSELERALMSAALARAHRIARMPEVPHAERSLGLAFSPGDQAIDLVTGQEVTIHAGHPTFELVPSPRKKIDGDVHGQNG